LLKKIYENYENKFKILSCISNKNTEARQQPLSGAKLQETSRVDGKYLKINDERFDLKYRRNN